MEPTSATTATRKHALYRFYGDDGALLYVGITNNPSSRFSQHSQDKPWWHEVRGISVEPYDDRESVEAAERRAIAVENPRYNKVRPSLRKATKARSRSHQLMWICDACHRPIADGEGYFHINEPAVYAVEQFWTSKDRARGANGSWAVDLSDIRDWPSPVAWQIHHRACDPDIAGLDYWIDVARARTHAHLLDITGHFIETKEWIKHTDWDKLIRRMAEVNA